MSWKSIRQVFNPHQMAHGSLLIGLRFQRSDTSTLLMTREPDIVSGAYSYTITKLPIAGPIFLVASGDPVRWAAVYAGCDERSKSYKKKSRWIRAWAHTHRCKTRKELACLM